MLTAGRCMYGINGICQLFFGSMRHRSKLVCSHSKSACLSLYRFRFCDQFLTDMAGAIVLAAYVGAIYIGSLVSMRIRVRIQLVFALDLSKKAE